MSLNYSIASRSATGGALLLSRQIVVQSANFVGTILLARFLSISDYGFFGIVYFLFSFIINFGDIGLSASLLHQTEEPTEKDYNIIFSAQIILTTLVALIFSISSPLLCKAYKLPNSFSLYFVLIAASLISTAFKVTPTARLERHLDFKWLSIIEIIQALIYNLCAAIMAYHRLGPLSFSLALLIRSIVGSILINIVSPRMPRFDTNFPILKKHLAFGLPFQASLFINSLKDSISPIIIGLILGISQTGTVNMAVTIAALPVMFLFIFSRIYFPAFSRAKSDSIQLNYLFRLFVRLSNSFVAPLAIFILIFPDQVISYIFSPKWLITKPLLFLLWSANVFVPGTLVCISLMNALGYAKTVLKYNLLWMILTLGLSTPLVFTLGPLGFGYANLAVNISMLLIFQTVGNLINVNIYKETILGWIPALLSVVVLILIKMLLPQGKLILTLSFLSYFILSSMVTILFSHKDLIVIIKSFNFRRLDEKQS